MGKRLLQFNQFEWNIPKIVVTLPQGKDALRLYKAYQYSLKTKFNNNSNLICLKYDEDSKSIKGSNLFA